MFNPLSRNRMGLQRIGGHVAVPHCQPNILLGLQRSLLAALGQLVLCSHRDNGIKHPSHLFETLAVFMFQLPHVPIVSLNTTLQDYQSAGGIREEDVLALAELLQVVEIPTHPNLGSAQES